MTISDAARDFIDACDTGKGWDVCKAYCHDDATFSCQADALAELNSLADYVGWAQGLLTPIPDAHTEMKAFGVDEARGTAVAALVFHGTQSGEGGPVPPTGKTVATDYVYVLEFDGPKIRHMNKIWNDGPALRALGWA
jgi:predicted ester cyclase